MSRSRGHALTVQGETVVDLGSGGGFDVLQAARKVGPTGFAIGLDASPNMLERARASAERQGLRPPHVAFAEADLTEALPLHSASVDVIISNCVVNLLSSEHKAALFRELRRCLRGGGRLAISDILARRPMPQDVLASFAARVGCIGGSITVEDQRRLLIEAGFDGAKMRSGRPDISANDIVFVEKGMDLNAYFTPGSSCAPSCGSTGSADLPANFDANEHAGACTCRRRN